MGLDAPSIALLSAAKSLGVDFRKTIMIGRQNFYGQVAPALRELFSVHRIDADADSHLKENFFGEPLFKLLGAEHVSSLDFSDYQQATCIHDLNQPVPPEWHKQFSVVYDGGAIEHVFNCPQAFRSCMDMVEVGGHFVQVNIANNFTGHGFWQFSPELIFRVLSPENGFRITTVLMHEVTEGGRWFVVADPLKIGQRVELCNSLPTYILTIAERVSDIAVLSQPPQQSDYVWQWSHGAKAKPQSGNSSSIKWSVKRLIPQSIKRELKQFVHWLSSNHRDFDPRCYRQVSDREVFTGKHLHS